MEPGEERDWPTWLSRHGRALVLFARQWVPGQADAEDIVQEAFVKFWRARGSADPETPYLYACVRNCALDWLRSRARREQREKEAGGLKPVLVEPVFERSPENAEWRADVERQLSELPAKQRAVLILKLWGSLTFREVGQALNIPQDTAASRYRYALESLRRNLQEAQRNG
jgi:RNA polymerase sigma-70 factor (ECF subfamily)